jgi:hypothetical protein
MLLFTFLSIIYTEKDRIMKKTAFGGKYNRDYAACLTNTVNLLVV